MPCSQEQAVRRDGVGVGVGCMEWHGCSVGAYDKHHNADHSVELSFIILVFSVWSVWSVWCSMRRHAVGVCDVLTVSRNSQTVGDGHSVM